VVQIQPGKLLGICDNNVCVAEGLRASPFRENTEPNIQDSANKGKHRSSKHHKTKKGENFREATRRLGCWGVN